MKKVRITAKPGTSKNYIRLNSIHEPVFQMDGNTLTGIQRPFENEIENLTGMPRPVVIPQNVDAISNEAFSGLDSLKSIHFGNAPYQLGSGVFSGCAELETAILAEGYEKIPMQTFADCGKLRLVRLPRSVKRINMDAFKNCGALKSITLPPELEAIEVSAFWGCRSLEEIDLPDSLTTLDNDAFANCIRLKNVRLSASLQKIGACAFQNCISLECIVIPEGVTALPLGVFAGCRNLKHIVLPDSLEYISPYAFYRCDALEFVECANPERFARALEFTPCGIQNRRQNQAGSRFPMELLNTFAGEIPGSMLTAMGYPWFDIDKKYRFFLSDTPGVIEEHSRRLDAEYPADALYDKTLIDEVLDPVW